MKSINLVALAAVFGFGTLTHSTASAWTWDKAFGNDAVRVLVGWSQAHNFNLVIQQRVWDGACITWRVNTSGSLHTGNGSDQIKVLGPNEAGTLCGFRVTTFASNLGTLYIYAGGGSDYMVGAKSTYLFGEKGRDALGLVEHASASGGDDNDYLLSFNGGGNLSGNSGSDSLCSFANPANLMDGGEGMDYQYGLAKIERNMDVTSLAGPTSSCLNTAMALAFMSYNWK